MPIMTQQEFDATLKELSTAYSEALSDTSPEPGPEPEPGNYAEYYISPDGNDSNDGLTEATAWLSPDHDVNAGDTLWAVDSEDYDAANFGPGKWGKVTGPVDGIYMAKLRAINPFKCKITSPNACMRVDKSGWAVIGWRAKNTEDNDGAFVGTPSNPEQIQYNAFVNCICEGAYRNGFSFYGYWGNKKYGFDYAAVVGCIAYNGAQGYALCHSGISMYQPVLSDNEPGTHLYVAGNFVIGNITPTTGCANGTNSDGNGFIADDFAQSQKDGPAVPYAGKTVVEYNMAIGNGWAGITTFKFSAGDMIVRYNTLYGNVVSKINDEYYSGELLASSVTGGSLTWTYNIAVADKATSGVKHHPTYGAFVGNCNASVKAEDNLFFGLDGHYQKKSDSEGFEFGENANVDPEFANPTIPSAPPVATDEETTAELMADTIDGFMPSAPEAQEKGYMAYDEVPASADFPKWLKGVIPAGLIPLPEGYAA